MCPCFSQCLASSITHNCWQVVAGLMQMQSPVPACSARAGNRARRAVLKHTASELSNGVRTLLTLERGNPWGMRPPDLSVRTEKRTTQRHEQEHSAHPSTFLFPSHCLAAAGVLGPASPPQAPWAASPPAAARAGRWPPENDDRALPVGCGKPNFLSLKPQKPMGLLHKPQSLNHA